MRKSMLPLASELASHMAAFHPDRYNDSEYAMFHVASPQGAVLFFRHPEQLAETRNLIENVLTEHGAQGAITFHTHNMPVPSARYRGKPPFQMYLDFEPSKALGHALWLQLLERYVNPEEHAYFPPEARKEWDNGFMRWPSESRLREAHRHAFENNRKTLEHLESVSKNLVLGNLSPQAQDFLSGKKDPNSPYALTQAHAEMLIGKNPLLSGHPRVGRDLLQTLSDNVANWLSRMGLTRPAPKGTPRPELLAEVKLHEALERMMPLGPTDRDYALKERKNIIDQVVVHLRAQQAYNHQALDALSPTPTK